MGLIALAIIISLILGSCIWLAAGDQFPYGEEVKWPVLNNICCYAAIVAVPIYLLIFFIF